MTVQFQSMSTAMPKQNVYTMRGPWSSARAAGSRKEQAGACTGRFTLYLIRAAIVDPSFRDEPHKFTAVKEVDPSHGPLEDNNQEVALSPVTEVTGKRCQVGTQEAESDPAAYAGSDDREHCSVVPMLGNKTGWSLKIW